MQHQPFITTLLCSTLLVTGCSALKSPVRPHYTGADSVSTAQTEQLIGVWSVTELNPYPGNEPQITTIEYREDGTVTGNVDPEGEGMEALGDLEFEISGNWTLENDVLSHQNMTMKSSNGNAMGSLLSQIVNSRPSISGKANIYEISDTRIVMVGSDGAAMEHLRQ